MSLLQDVVALLDRNAIDHTLIGAAALAIHGVSRSTADIDLFTLDDKALQEQLWSDLRGRGVNVRSLRGDHEDPLAGSVRLAMAGERTVDVVVGRYGWQKKIVESSEVTSIGEVAVKVREACGARPLETICRWTEGRVGHSIAFGEPRECGFHCSGGEL